MCIEFIKIISSVLIAFSFERIWDFFKNKKDFKNSKEKLLKEINYNRESGVGCPACPFKLKQHENFLEFNISKEVKSDS